MNPESFSAAFPELFLAFFGVLSSVYVVGFHKRANVVTMHWMSVFVFLILITIISLRPDGDVIAFGGLFHDNEFTRYSKILILLLASAAIIMPLDYISKRGFLFPEYHLFLQFTVLGMMVAVSANNVFLIFLSFEIISIALYSLVAFQKNKLMASEAALKYFIAGALSSCILLYGISIIYGFSGGTAFEFIEVQSSKEVSRGFLFGVIFLIIGILAKLAIAPFHFWAPDTYQGAPTPVTAFLITIPVIAFLAVLTQLILGPLMEIKQYWQPVLMVCAGVSMVWGALASLTQTDIKRLLAYLAVMNIGFIVLIISTANNSAIFAALIFLTNYSLVIMGLFAFILTMERDGLPVTDIKSLNRYWQVSPVKATALMILIFSMLGLPPLIGFFGKFLIFESLWAGKQYILLLISSLSLLIGSIPLLRIVAMMMWGDEVEPLENRDHFLANLILLIIAGIMVAGVFTMFGLEGAAEKAASSLF